MELSEIAKKLYLEGYNCCESILHSLRKNNVITIPDEVIRSATGFRAGVVGSGCICGVITAGIIAIGLRYGRIDKKENKEEVDRRVKLFYDKFREKFKSPCCRILTKNWKDNFNSHKRRNYCAEIVAQMITELQKILVDG